jgi:hypothetical protein
MKKIQSMEYVPVTRRVTQMTFIPIDEYETVSGMRFKSKTAAQRHENYISTMSDYYKKLLSLFGIDFLKSLLNDWEAKQHLWEGHPQYGNYIGANYALKAVIEEHENKRNIEMIFKDMRRGYYD